MNRTIVYIDGFNFYYGMKAKYKRKYSWLDLYKFSKSILPPDNQLVLVKYFTSRVKGFPDDPLKPERQSAFIDALLTLPNFMIFEGNYQCFKPNCRYCHQETIVCSNCGHDFIKPNEKKTDVNITTELLIDAFENNCDTQILISGDSDYESPLKALRRLFPDKILYVAFPPKRKNPKLKIHSVKLIEISEEAFSQSLLPDDIVLPSGYHIRKPDSWV
jgi:uncharacterized LabA/DUF88 family protein